MTQKKKTSVASIKQKEKVGYTMSEPKSYDVDEFLERIGEYGMLFGKKIFLGKKPIFIA